MIFFSIHIPSDSGKWRPRRTEAFISVLKALGQEQRITMQRLRIIDALVIEYSDTYKCIGETDIDKTYEMPKSFVSYRKPRRLTDEQRKAARERVKALKHKL